MAKILVGVGAHALHLPNMKHVLPKAVHGGPLAELDGQHGGISLPKGMSHCLTDVRLLGSSGCLLASVGHDQSRGRCGLAFAAPGQIRGTFGAGPCAADHMLGQIMRSPASVEGPAAGMNNCGDNLGAHWVHLALCTARPTPSPVPLSNCVVGVGALWQQSLTGLRASPVA